MSRPAGRETFGSRFGLIMVMIGVAAGLGNIWRFPYMVGRFGGAAFVLVYVTAVLAIGVPALMAEWALGRHTRRGPVGAFERAGLPLGQPIGWFFFCVVVAATGYYTAVIGWVLFHAVALAAGGLGVPVQASAILPPATGFAARSFALQAGATGLVILSCVTVLLRGLRSGIEAASKVITPALFLTLLVLIVRSTTLPGSFEGIHWYLLKFELADLSPRVILAGLGQAVFSLSLGGTFMVIYGSYLRPEDDLASGALFTAFGDTAVGLLAGLVIFPAVFAQGLEPTSGPGLLFATLPGVFASIPAGALFGILFFGALFGAAYLSDVAAFEVLVAGLTDNLRMGRKRAVWLMAGLVFLLSLPPTLNMKVFVPWDLTFGSGMQTLGVLLAVLTAGWALRRADALRELAPRSAARRGEAHSAAEESEPGHSEPPPALTRALYYWLRFVVPGAILAVGIWWLLTDVLGVSRGV
ncbi:MAG: sodium-dependent transporter [Gemmatimonadota bacterium]